MPIWCVKGPPLVLTVGGDLVSGVEPQLETRSVVHHLRHEKNPAWLSTFIEDDVPRAQFAHGGPTHWGRDSCVECQGFPAAALSADPTAKAVRDDVVLQKVEDDAGAETDSAAHLVAYASGLRRRLLSPDPIASPMNHWHRGQSAAVLKWNGTTSKG